MDDVRYAKLREDRQRLIKEARELNERGTDEAPLTNDDHAKVMELLNRAEGIGRDLVREDELRKAENVPTLPESQRRERDEERAGDAAALLGGGPGEQREKRTTLEQYAEALNGYMRGGMLELPQEQRQILRRGQVIWSEAERRAMSVGTDAAGGYTVFEDQRFASMVIEGLKQWGGVIQAGADVTITTDGADLPYNADDDTSNVASIVAEGGSHAGGADMSFSQVILEAYNYSSLVVLVSWQLLQDARVDIEALLAQRIGIRHGRGQNAHFTTGTGTGQPRGVMTAATNGVTAATGNTTSIPADDIPTTIHSVDPAYRTPMAKWMMHDNTALAIRLLKDSNNNYLWRDALNGGPEIPRLGGYEVVINNDVAVMAANAYSAAFGDFSAYKIRRVGGLRIMRLEERYADTGQVGFIGWMRTDGDLVDPGTNPVKTFRNSAT